MTKATRALSGKAKDLFLEGVVRSALADDPVTRERLLRELTQAIAGLRIRIDAEKGRSAITDWTTRILAADPSAASEAVAGAPQGETASAAAKPSSESAPASPVTAPAAPFDPYTPNVIVVLRTKGRDAAIAALATIDQPEQLRELAHEQQLGLPPEAATPAQIREAIVAAAERRVSNRQAAGR